MRITTALVFAMFLCFSTYGLVFAQSSQIGFSSLDPSSPFYFLKTIRESWELKFFTTPQTRWVKQLEFSTRRIREVNTLVTKDQDLIAPTLEKYKTSLNSVPQKDLGDSDAEMRIEQALSLHLNTLQLIYNQISNINARMAIRAAINIIIERVDIPEASRIPACNFLSQEASSSALNQTERVVLASRAQKCLQINSL